MNPPLPPGLYRDSLLWRSNGASSSANVVAHGRRLRRPPCSSPYQYAEYEPPPGNKLIAIMKVKIMILYKACKCDCSIAIRACGVAISQEVVTLARMRELHINIEYGTGARSYILKWCQEPHFNYYIQYSLQI